MADFEEGTSNHDVSVEESMVKEQSGSRGKQRDTTAFEDESSKLVSPNNGADRVRVITSAAADGFSPSNGVDMLESLLHLPEELQIIIDHDDVEMFVPCMMDKLPYPQNGYAHDMSVEDSMVKEHSGSRGKQCDATAFEDSYPPVMALTRRYPCLMLEFSVA